MCQVWCVMWCYVIWEDVMWCDVVWCGVVWCGVVWLYCVNVYWDWCSTVCVMLCYGMLCYAIMIWHDMTWHDIPSTKAEATLDKVEQEKLVELEQKEMESLMGESDLGRWMDGGNEELCAMWRWEGESCVRVTHVVCVCVRVCTCVYVCVCRTEAQRHRYSQSITGVQVPYTGVCFQVSAQILSWFVWCNGCLCVYLSVPNCLTDWLIDWLTSSTYLSIYLSIYVCLSVSYVSRLSSAQCQACHTAVLPSQAARTASTAAGGKKKRGAKNMKHIRANCGHWLHHYCLDVMLTTPPFLHQCTVGSCQRKVGHPDWSDDIKQLERAWLLEEAKKRELVSKWGSDSEWQFMWVLWYDVIWYDVMWCTTMYYDVVWCKVIWWNVMWCTVWSGVISCCHVSAVCVVISE